MINKFQRNLGVATPHLPPVFSCEARNRKTAYNSYDMSTKFPTLHPYNSPKLDSIKFIVSSNSLPSNPKLYYLLSNLSQGITGQLPAIIKAKKSVASFKLRKNSPVAIYTTLRKHKASVLLNNLTLFYLPLLVANGSTLNLTSSNNKKVLRHSYSFGFNNISYLSYIQLPTRGSGLANEFYEGRDKPSLEEDQTFSKILGNVGGYIQLNSRFFDSLPSFFNLLKKGKNTKKGEGISRSENINDFGLLAHSFYISLLLPYPFGNYYPFLA